MDDDVRGLALPLDEPRDLDPLIARIGDARFVLLGKASHGTQEFYAWRAALTRRLATEKRFSVEDLIAASVDSDEALFVVPDAPPSWLTQRRDHRAIGVVYDPGSEHWGNYVPTVLGRRYDAFCWFRDSRVLVPIGDSGDPSGELETWPAGQ